MTKLHFDDGLNLDTGGPYRVAYLADGYYCVGRGMSIPCRNGSEARTLAGRFMVAALHHIDKDAVAVLCAALNSANWAEIDPDGIGPGAIATPQNLPMFDRKKAMIPAMLQYRDAATVQRPELIPLVDKILAELEDE